MTILRKSMIAMIALLVISIPGFGQTAGKDSDKQQSGQITTINEVAVARPRLDAPPFGREKSLTITATPDTSRAPLSMARSGWNEFTAAEKDQFYQRQMDAFANRWSVVSSQPWTDGDDHRRDVGDRKSVVFVPSSGPKVIPR